MTSERFFIDNSLKGVERYNWAKFMFFDVDNFDPLTSTFMQEIGELPVGGYFKVTNEEKRIDMISYKIYGSSSLYWILMLYNDLTTPEEVEVGTTIAYPTRRTLEVFLDGMQARKSSQN